MNYLIIAYKRPLTIMLEFPSPLPSLTVISRLSQMSSASGPVMITLEQPLPHETTFTTEAEPDTCVKLKQEQEPIYFLLKFKKLTTYSTL